MTDNRKRTPDYSDIRRAIQAARRKYIAGTILRASPHRSFG